MKKFLSVICLLLTLCMVLPACGGDPVETDLVDPGEVTEVPETESETEAEAEETEPEEEIYMERTYTMKDAEGLFNPLGRTAMVGTSLTVDWTGAGAAFSAECKGDFKMTFNAGSTSNYLRIEVDGVITKNFKPDKGTKTYAIAKDLKEGIHNIRVVSEAGYGTWNCSEIVSVTLTGKLLEEKPKDVYIEFIGASTEAGSGTMGGHNDAYTYDVHSATHSYTYRTAVAMDADYSIVARGGIGLLKKNGKHSMNTLYFLQNGYRNDTEYGFERKPDIICTSLPGGNDRSQGEEALYEAFVPFLKHLQRSHGIRYKEVTADDDYTFERDGKYYYFGHDIIEGRIRETPCPPYMENDHRNQFESWKKTGGMVAAFFGHDHVNDFRINVDGINLYQTLGAGYCTYGKERGGRLIILDENNPTEIYTESLEVERITDLDI